MLVRQPGSLSFSQVSSNRPGMPAATNALADKIAVLLADEPRGTDREVAACAFVTLAHRLRQEQAHPAAAAAAFLALPEKCPIGQSTTGPLSPRA